MTFWLWILLISVAIAYELFTVFDRDSGTWPLTWVYRRLMCQRWLRVMVMAFFGWMIWHWVIQFFGPWQGNGWVDVAFTVAGGIFGWFAKPQRFVKCDEA